MHGVIIADISFMNETFSASLGVSRNRQHVVNNNSPSCQTLYLEMLL